MKYEIEDIKTWGEIIIDDDQTFDELIEFYLLFRLSEIDPNIIQKAEAVKEKYSSYAPDSNVALKLNPKGPALMEVTEQWYDLVDYLEIKHLGPSLRIFQEPEPLISLYVALATHADKSRDDRVLAMDIIYFLLLMAANWFDDDEPVGNRFMLSCIAERVAIQWGDRDVAGLILADVLSCCTSPFHLQESVDCFFFGALSDLVGVECYFDRIPEMIKEEKESFFGYGEDDDISHYIIPLAQKSIRYLDDDSFARELYKRTLEYYEITNIQAENILEMSKSIIEDLKDKRWAEEVTDLLSMWNNKKEVLAACKNSGGWFALSNASEVLQADKEIVMGKGICEFLKWDISE